MLSVVRGKLGNDEQLMPRAGNMQSGSNVLDASTAKAEKAAQALVEAAKVVAVKTGLPAPTPTGGEVEVGGKQDCIRNAGEEYCKFTRRSSAWRSSYFKTIQKDFNDLIPEKAARDLLPNTSVPFS